MVLGLERLTAFLSTRSSWISRMAGTMRLAFMPCRPFSADATDRTIQSTGTDASRDDDRVEPDLAGTPISWYLACSLRVSEVMSSVDEKSPDGHRSSIAHSLRLQAACGREMGLSSSARLPHWGGSPNSAAADRPCIAGEFTAPWPRNSAGLQSIRPQHYEKLERIV